MSSKIIKMRIKYLQKHNTLLIFSNLKKPSLMLLSSSVKPTRLINFFEVITCFYFLGELLKNKLNSCLNLFKTLLFRVSLNVELVYLSKKGDIKEQYSKKLCSI